MKSTPMTLAFTFALALSSGPVPAQSGPGVMKLSDTPEVISGGVGIGNREAMMQRFEDHNLHLGFARPDGAFLADVGVTIRDKAGEVVWSGTSPGPLLFARLHPGTYSVQASFAGRSEKRTIDVAKRAGSMHYLHLSTASEGPVGSAGSSQGSSATGAAR